MFDRLRAIRAPIGGDEIVGFINLSLLHREVGYAWDAFECGRASSSALTLLAGGVDLNGLLEGLSEADAPQSLEQALELWREMRKIHVPPEAEALTAFTARLVINEQYEAAFGAVVVGLEADMMPTASTCVTLVRACAASSEWAPSAYAVLVAMRGNGMGLDPRAHPQLFLQMAQALAIAGQDEPAREVFSEADAVRAFDGLEVPTACAAQVVNLRDRFRIANPPAPSHSQTGPLSRASPSLGSARPRIPQGVKIGRSRTQPIDPPHLVQN